MIYYSHNIVILPCTFNSLVVTLRGSLWDRGEEIASKGKKYIL